MSNSPTVVDIIRVAQSDDQGTFGVLVLNGRAFCVTLELRWQNNERNVSCIPTGSYLCKRTQSARFGKAFTVREVEGRSHILLHRGNTVRDTSGCILLGRRFGNHAIHNSRPAFKAFMAALKGRETFKLTIKECLC